MNESRRNFLVATAAVLGGLAFWRVQPASAAFKPWPDGITFDGSGRPRLMIAPGCLWQVEPVGDRSFQWQSHWMMETREVVEGVTIDDCIAAAVGRFTDPRITPWRLWGGFRTYDDEVYVLLGPLKDELTCESARAAQQSLEGWA